MSLNPEQMIEIRWHGRGGQGAVTSAEILAAGSHQRRQVCSGFSQFWAGKKRSSGAGFCQNQRQPAYPDQVFYYRTGCSGSSGPRSCCSIVNVASGLKPGGIVIINTTKTAAANPRGI